MTLKKKFEIMRKSNCYISALSSINLFLTLIDEEVKKVFLLFGCMQPDDELGVFTC